jgi:hypothetical protein
MITIPLNSPHARTSRFSSNGDCTVTIFELLNSLLGADDTENTLNRIVSGVHCALEEHRGVVSFVRGELKSESM